MAFKIFISFNFINSKDHVIFKELNLPFKNQLVEDFFISFDVKRLLCLQLPFTSLLPDLVAFLGFLNVFN